MVGRVSTWALLSTRLEPLGVVDVAPPLAAAPEAVPVVPVVEVVPEVPEPELVLEVPVMPPAQAPSA